METAAYVEKISALFSRIMVDPLETRLPPEAEEIELTNAQIQGLLYLFRHSCSSVGDLAEGLYISHPAAVKLVGRLQRKGLVIRTESEKDRRISEVVLTDFGRDIAEKIQAERLKLLVRATEQMESDELEALLAGLEAFLSAILISRGTVERVCLRCGTNHIGCCPVNRAYAVLTGTGIEKT